MLARTCTICTRSSNLYGKPEAQRKHPLEKGAWDGDLVENEDKRMGRQVRLHFLILFPVQK